MQALCYLLSGESGWVKHRVGLGGGGYHLSAGSCRASTVHIQDCLLAACRDKDDCVGVAESFWGSWESPPGWCGFKAARLFRVDLS